MSLTPSDLEAEVKLCRARCCACAKKMKKMKLLLEDIPKVMEDPAIMCDHCINTKSSCKRCQFLAKINTVDKSQCNQQMQRFLSDWATELKRLQCAIISCKDICEKQITDTCRSYKSASKSRDLDVDSFTFGDTYGDTSSGSDFESQRHEVKTKSSKEIKIQTKTKTEREQSKKKDKSKKKPSAKKVPASSPSGMISGKGGEKGKKGEKEKKGEKGKKMKKEKEIPLLKMVCESNTNFTQFEVSKNTKCPPEILRRPLFRDSMMDLEKLKELAAFDDSTQIRADGKIIRICDVVKYKEEPELEYDLPKQIVYSSKSSSLKSSSFVDEEEEIIEPIQDDHQQTTRVVKESKKTRDHINTLGHGPGRFKYALSDQNYILKGWTRLPTLKTVRLVRMCRMVRSPSIYDWFKIHKNSTVFYECGGRLGQVDRHTYGYWYYKSGLTAFFKGEKDCVIYSDIDNNSSEPSILAWFDQLGNGVIYDCDGNIRVQYNQVDGGIKEESLCPPNSWNWYVSDEKPRFKNIYAEKMHGQKSLKERMMQNESAIYIQNSEDEMLILEDNFTNKLYDKTLQYTIAQMRMKVFKINNNFALRIVDQHRIFVTFSEGNVYLRFNVGMRMDRTDVLTIKEASMVKGIPLLIKHKLEKTKELGEE